MGIFKSIFGDWFGGDSGPVINPANGLPMMDDSGIDIEGNPYGTDSEDFNNGGINNDDFGSNDAFSNDDVFNDNNGFGDDNF